MVVHLTSLFGQNASSSFDVFVYRMVRLGFAQAHRYVLIADPHS